MQTRNTIVILGNLKHVWVSISHTKGVISNWDVPLLANNE